jgi:transcription initiation factor TFIIF subunit beta
VGQDANRQGKLAAFHQPRQLSHSWQQEQKKKEAAKENRASRLPKNELIDILLDLFQYYKYWGLRELKKKTNQPDAYLREVLTEIATMWKSGDLNGKWELKPELKEREDPASFAEGMAPEAADSEADLGEDDDENETFEDV